MKIVFSNSSLIASHRALKLKQGEIIKHGDPLIRPESPWEGTWSTSTVRSSRPRSIGCGTRLMASTWPTPVPATASIGKSHRLKDSGEINQRSVQRLVWMMVERNYRPD